MLNDADTLQLARDLWPAVTTAAASDAFLTAWLPACRQRVDETLFDEVGMYDFAVAHLLAHHAYRIDPAGLLGFGGAGVAGQVTGITQGKISVSLAGPTASGGGVSDAALRMTAPGQEFLSIRNGLPGVGPITVAL